MNEVLVMGGGNAVLGTAITPILLENGRPAPTVLAPAPQRAVPQSF